MMKKLLLLVFGLIIFSMTALTAKAVTLWHPPVVDIYIEKGDYYQSMKDAFNEWCWASDRRFLFNLSATKGMKKNGDVKVYFGDNDDVVSEPRTGLRRDFVYVTLKMTDSDGKPLPKDIMYVKMLHYAGIVMGLQPSENPKSVMYPSHLRGQKILEEDAVNLYNLYGWKIPKKGLKIR